MSVRSGLIGQHEQLELFEKLMYSLMRFELCENFLRMHCAYYRCEYECGHC